MRPLRPDPAKDPTLEFERAAFAAGARLVIGIDEVGRGAIAGPVAVGAQVVFAGTERFPEGLRDSKLLSERRRELLAPEIARWAPGAVGFGAADEIERHGITTMLGRAARRALLQLREEGVAVEAAVILVDGSHDWLSPQLRSKLDVRTRVGADRACASAAAASVRAKVSRDAVMRAADEEHPAYGWASNKGYGAAVHYAGIAAHGLTPLHRASWIRGR